MVNKTLKIFLRLIITAFLSVNIAALPSRSAVGSSSTPDELVEQGKTELLENNNIQLAIEKFNEAKTIDPGHKKANLWSAVTAIYENAELFGNKSAQLPGLFQNFGFLNLNKEVVVDAQGEPTGMENFPSAVDNIILDNNTATFAGEWDTLLESDSLDTYGPDCRAHSVDTIGGSTATWSPNIVVPGHYNVRAWVANTPENITDAEYHLAWDSGTSFYWRSQQRNGWVYLDTLDLNTGTVSPITLYNRSAFPSGRVIADAVKLQYEGFREDDSSSGFSFTGAWETNEGPENIWWSSRWHAADPTESATAAWTVNLPLTGRYDVLVKFRSLPGVSNNAEYVISPNGGTEETVTIDQNDSGRWISLGIFDFPNTSNNVVTLKSSAEGIVIADGIRFDPIKTLPNATEMQDKMSSLLTQMDDAIARLAVPLSDPAFVETVTVDSDTMHLDWADVKALEAFFYFMKEKICIASAYNMDNADLQKWMSRSNLSMDIIYGAYANLLTPMPDAAAKLGSAKTAYENMINSYFAASDFIRNNRNDGNINLHLVRLYEPGADQEDIDRVLEEEANFRSIFGDILNNLTDQASHPYVHLPVREFFFSEDDFLPGVPPNINFNSFYTNPINFRAFSEELLEHDYIYDDFSDPTMGGFLPGWTPAEWNYIFGHGPNFNDDEMTVLWNESTPSVKLSWQFSDSDTGAEHITKYEIYRSTTPDVTLSSQKIATITNPATMTFTDNNLGQGNDFYYKIYTYFDFGGGKTAISGSDIAHMRIRLYVDANYAGAEPEDGSKQHPYKDLGDTIREIASNGTKLHVAKGIYRETAATLKLWSKNNIRIEGGYEPVNWTRNIQDNVTTIDATGLETGGWQAVAGFSNVSGSVLDGFSITGITDETWSQGIDIYNSSSITIKNCRIYNCNKGISVQMSSSVTILNCVLEGRKGASAGSEGISVNSSNAVDIRNCNINNFYWQGITIANGSSANIENCEISQNGKGGINSYGAGSVSVKGCKIIGNGGVGDGAFGINFSAFDSGPVSQMAIHNNLIQGNMDTGIACSGNDITPVGSVNITNNTVANNGVCGIAYFNLQSIVIQNNITYNNNNGSVGIGIQELGTTPSTRIISNNDAFGAIPEANNYQNCGTSAGSNGNISSDPLFAAGPSGDYYLSQIASGQSSDSPCVNAGAGTASALGLDSTTTSTNQTGDTGTVDIGYHYLSALPSDIIIDNTDTTHTIAIGTWAASTSSPGYYGTNYQYRNAGTGTKKFLWKPNIVISGTYEIFARWAAKSNRATNAKYTVTGYAPVEVNQQLDGGKWVSIGQYNLPVGSTSNIELNDNANGIVVADAVKVSLK